MYPAHYFHLFPAFPRDDTVFVAMSFDSRFQPRWESVISRAVSEVAADDRPLKAIRVDARVVGDSILTEILAGISRARLVIADVTSLGVLADKPVRNGNVMYEIGLAHAVRLPEEVLLIRSDSDPLLFDTAQVRVNSYSPDDNPEQAREQIRNAIVSALRELDLRRHLAVRSAADSLDLPSLGLLADCEASKLLQHPAPKTMGQVLTSASIESAIQRLLSMGLLQMRCRAYPKDELGKLNELAANAANCYERTRFGDAVFQEVSSRLVASPASTAPAS